MATPQKLARLLLLQQRLKKLHEAKQAAFLREASAAEREAAEIAEQLQNPAGLSALFPDLYHKRIGRALARCDSNREKAAQESTKILEADARAKMVESAHREALRKSERADEEKAILELLQAVIAGN